MNKYRNEKRHRYVDFQPFRTSVVIKWIAINSWLMCAMLKQTPVLPKVRVVFVKLYAHNYSDKLKDSSLFFLISPFFS